MQSYTWHPSDLTGGGLTIVNGTTNLFCSSHSFLPDGRLLVAGGHSRYNPTPWKDGIGEPDLNIFDYRNNFWLRVGAMPKGRWYPSSVTLGTGETVIASGAYWDGVTMESDGSPSTAISRSIDKFTLTSTLTGTVQTFTNESPRLIWLYPYLHLAPNGDVFIAGAGAEPSRYFQATGSTGTFVDGPSYSPPTHFDGSAVVYDGVAGKVMMVGGVAGTLGSPQQTITTAETMI